MRLKSLVALVIVVLPPAASFADQLQTSNSGIIAGWSGGSITAPMTTGQGVIAGTTPGTGAAGACSLTNQSVNSLEALQCAFTVPVIPNGGTVYLPETAAAGNAQAKVNSIDLKSGLEELSGAGFGSKGLIQ